MYAPLDFDGFSHLSELTALGNKSFDKEFEILENKLGFKFSDKMKQFYNKMGFTGRPDCNIRIKIKKPDGNLFDSDLGLREILIFITLQFNEQKHIVES